MKVLRNLFVPVALLFIAAAANAAPGDLDPGFGGGYVATSFGGRSQNIAKAAAIQPDGKILLAGYSQQSQQYSQIALVRYKTDGSLDELFSGGKIATAVGISSYANDVVLQPDGKILVAATAQIVNGNSDFAVVRYNSNGTLDTSFGNNGVVTTAVGTQTDEASSIVLQPDGKIIIAGSSLIISGYDYAAVRYNSDGTPDLSFGQNGKIIISIGEGDDRAAAVDLQSNGKIIITGIAGFETNRIATVRCNPDGSLDLSFGQNGKSVTSVGPVSGGSDVVIQPNGKIIVAGATTANGGDFTVVRYNADGQLDNSFGNGGIVVTSINSWVDYASSVALQSDDKIVVGGTSAQPGDGNFAVARYNQDGSLDTSFGTGGKVTTSIGSYFSEVSILIQPDGKIVAAGSDLNGQTNGDPIDFAAARYLSGVSKRLDFDGDGKSDVSVFRPSNGVWYLQQSSAGFTGIAFGTATDKLVPADYDGDGKTDVAVVRNGTWYLQRSSLGFTGIQFGDGSDIPVPADYDGDGKSEIAVFRPSNGYWYLLNITNNQFTAAPFGISTDRPVPADYDGDGKADIAVNRDGNWYLQRSQLGFTGIRFGDGSDKTVPADYDGDGRTDIAVFRPSNGTWYLQQSTAGFSALTFGVGTDLPTPGDYDGDARADVAVFRGGTWYLNRTTQGFTGITFGAAADTPIPNTFVR